MRTKLAAVALLMLGLSAPAISNCNQRRVNVLLDCTCQGGWTWWPVCVSGQAEMGCTHLICAYCCPIECAFMGMDQPCYFVGRAGSPHGPNVQEEKSTSTGCGQPPGNAAEVGKSKQDNSSRPQ